MQIHQRKMEKQLKERMLSFSSKANKKYIEYEVGNQYIWTDRNSFAKSLEETNTELRLKTEKKKGTGEQHPILFFVDI